MQDVNGQVKVFVAFVRGVAMVFPEFATRMIQLLGASPAEEVVVAEPEVIRRSRKATGGLVVSGTSVQTGKFEGDTYERDSARQPRKSWKTYRATQYHIAA